MNSLPVRETKKQEKTMEQEKIIRDIKELLKFPGIGKSLLHKIEELKGVISGNIEKYSSLIEEHPQRKTGYPTAGTRFELRRLGEKLWIPSIPDSRRINAYEVVPQPIIDYIVDNQENAGIIGMKPGLRFPGIPGQVFDLVFEKISPTYIWGMIQPYQENPSEFIYPNRPAITSTPADLEVGEKSDKQEILKLVLYYLLNHRDYYSHVAAEFFYHWKPLIDSHLITASAV
jgi:hypothetical protein